MDEMVEHSFENCFLMVACVVLRRFSSCILFGDVVIWFGTVGVIIG